MGEIHLFIVTSNEGQISDDNLLSTYNTAMGLAGDRFEVQRSPLASQLEVPWESATPKVKEKCLEQAKEDCLLLVCNMIAPGSGSDLLICLHKI